MPWAFQSDGGARMVSAVGASRMKRTERPAPHKGSRLRRAWFAVLLILPIVASLAVARYRTTADRDTVTARSLISSKTVPWEDVDGLRFDRSAWASAHLKDGSDVRLPAVTFATLPQLTAATDGRVPNPYE